jgi:hypothetical protein
MTNTLAYYTMCSFIVPEVGIASWHWTHANDDATIIISIFTFYSEFLILFHQRNETDALS